jgi:hypothetical protein
MTAGVGGDGLVRYGDRPAAAWLSPSGPTDPA